MNTRMAFIRQWAGIAAAFLSVLFIWRAWAASTLKADEQIVFLPAIGRELANGGWEISVSGFVFEQESRPGVRPAFRKYLGLDDATMSDEEQRIFQQRTLPFLIDAEGGKQVTIRVGETRQVMQVTTGDGHFGGALQLPPSTVANNSRLSVECVLEARDTRRFTAPVFLVPRRGLSVISDIDDTIKISEVTNRQALLLNTFVRPFKPVPGMALTYQSWRTNQNACFHYVSASPWQLYPALNGFTETNRFPPGTFHLRVLDWRREAFGNHSPVDYKRQEITRLLAMFPERDFVMVGDSGERDPEIYGDLAREHPGRIRHIFIRSLTGETGAEARYQEAFRSLPADKWRVFKEPVQLPGIL
jgi:phosphatidate phosphatase APP1